MGTAADAAPLIPFLKSYRGLTNVALRVPANRITAILAGRRAVTAETALRLARHFGTTAAFWLNLQKVHELKVAEQETGPRIRAEVAPRTAA